MLLGTKSVFKHQDLQMFGLNVVINFHPLEVVGGGTETQLQVGGHLNYECSALRVRLQIDGEG